MGAINDVIIAVDMALYGYIWNITMFFIGNMIIMLVYNGWYR